MKRLSIVTVVLFVLLLGCLAVIAAPDNDRQPLWITSTGVLRELPTGTARPTLMPPDGTAYPDATYTAQPTYTREAP